MNRSRVARWCGPLIGLGLILVLSRAAGAQSLSPEDQAFFDKHSSDVIRLEPTRLSDPTFVRVFSIPVFHVKLIIKLGDGGDESMETIVARSGDKLVSVGRPSSDADMPDFPKMLNPAFKLKSDSDAKDMQAAMDVVYPIIGDDDKKAATVRHSGTQWTFIRGKFFNNFLGFVFETDANGTITSAKFSLKIPA